MRILYLIMLYNGDINGGHSYRMATVNAIKSIVGDNNLDIVLSELDTSDWNCNIVMRTKNYSRSIDKIHNLIQGNITQRSDDDIRSIIGLIKKNNYDIVIFGSSETGKLIREVKRKCKVKTITWYHDVIADVISNKIRIKHDIIKYPVWRAEVKAEKIDAKYTDIPIVLNKRDANLLEKYWGRKAEAIIPIALEDRYEEDDESQVYPGDSLKLLFVGSYNWAPNIEAVKWFCERVMIMLENDNVEFVVAGFNMERLIDEDWIQRCKNIKIIGTVDNLNKIYSSVDVVVEPITIGSGMKVKTAEALMHGKVVIGTKEAFEGYDELEDYICNSADDYIKRIKHFIRMRPLRFCMENRIIYEKKYSVEALVESLREIIG